MLRLMIRDFLSCGGESSGLLVERFDLLLKVGRQSFGFGGLAFGVGPMPPQAARVTATITAAKA